jgi:predicted RNA-binding protein associated with RNAse of E/G family
MSILTAVRQCKTTAELKSLDDAVRKNSSTSLQYLRAFDDADRFLRAQENDFLPQLKAYSGVEDLAGRLQKKWKS